MEGYPFYSITILRENSEKEIRYSEDCERCFKGSTMSNDRKHFEIHLMMNIKRIKLRRFEVILTPLSSTGIS